MSAAGLSNVGQPSIYEDGDQRNAPQSEVNQRQRYKEGQPHSHRPNDTKDERSIANRLAREEQRERRHEEPVNPEAELSKQDPTKPAVVHGNNPSRGAEIDKELQNDDEQRLREKGIKK
ncbi:hypothetical protein DTO166G4_8564 [Paecilomyces variotii]|uniref:Uncharacterized protein n=1 Tax=Byssochlamys spectabilis TaxID=264951 RepID=A0A443I7Y7_BYSSP|nr:hypothetical protein C8Q69DRAFT_47795 [Paecilomyces variotii]KAJ9199455.1 hypothetical protein DTO032I3_4978 [Paecilomyces variotii]KAJ9207423.1 hypothetical protein DTO164E3_697 [Paecilomyces variotii]KAJ9209814.1 hypothetical protein DTO166G4_8564 [Paecilomyces variotii]KAJ9221823.1 hypothetical protein DTO169C6_5786 [Paecilomyces variotii]KAJ9232427.1 hypothetical protein DTO166G5_6212 [Paecilomyces variotii]